MKTPLLVGVIVAVHVVAVGSAVLIQGCGTMQPSKTEPAVATPVPTPGAPVAEVSTKTAELKAPESVPQVLPPVETKTTVEKLSADTTTYTVGKGDTLSLIAFKYGLKVPEIMALNNMTNASKLKLGQKLILPGKINLASPKHHVAKKAKTEETKGEAKAETKAEGAGEYTVKAGDSLSKIASKHGTTQAAIKKANNMTTSVVKVGQKLMIPGGVAKTAKKEEKAVEKAPAGEAATAVPEVGPAVSPASAPTTPAVAPDVSAPAAAMPATAPATVTEPVTTAPAKSGATQNYTVEQNDDLVKVSKMWGVSVDELKKVNGLTDNTLKPGQVLKIPIVE